jgi:Domain of unknown function (DUF4062)
MEYWSATGRRSLRSCLEKVDEAEAVVVIVAHRYGWVPDDPDNPHGKSITWLECERAWQCNKGVLGFLVDPKYDWPKELYENYRLVEGRNLPERKFNALRREVRRNEQRLEEFKRTLSANLRKEFTTAAGFRALVSEALLDWRLQNQTYSSVPVGDPDIYLKALEDDTRRIRITGLATKRALFLRNRRDLYPSHCCCEPRRAIHGQPRGDGPGTDAVSP